MAPLSIADGIPAAVAAQAVELYADTVAKEFPDVANVIAALVSDRALPIWGRYSRKLTADNRDPENVAQRLGSFFKAIFTIWAMSWVWKKEELEDDWKDAWEGAKWVGRKVRLYETIGDFKSADVFRACQEILVQEAGDIHSLRSSKHTIFIDRDRDNQKAGGQAGHRRDLRGFVIQMERFHTAMLNDPLRDVIATEANIVFDLVRPDELNARRVADMTRVKDSGL
jgi:hypothetical protein